MTDSIELDFEMSEEMPTNEKGGFMSYFPSQGSATDGIDSGTRLVGHPFEPNRKPPMSDLDSAVDVIKKADIQKAFKEGVDINAAMSDLSVEDSLKTKYPVHVTCVIGGLLNVSLNDLASGQKKAEYKLTEQSLQKLSADGTYTSGDISRSILRGVRVLETHSEIRFPVGVTVSGCKKEVRSADGKQHFSFLMMPGESKSNRDLNIFKTDLPEDKIDRYANSTYEEMINPCKAMADGEFIQVPEANHIVRFCEKNKDKDLDLTGFGRIGNSKYFQVPETACSIAAQAIKEQAFDEILLIDPDNFKVMFAPTDGLPWNHASRALHLPEDMRADFFDQPFSMHTYTENTIQTLRGSEELNVRRLHFSTRTD